MLIEYIKKGKAKTKKEKMKTKKSKARTKKGILVAIPSEETNTINFGFSLCDLKQDDFDKNFGWSYKKSISL